MNDIVPVKQATDMTIDQDNMFFDIAAFEHAQRVSTMLASSTLVPEHFRGKENVGNCMIALNLALRLKLDPFMIMQKVYMIKGKPGIESQLAIALINKSGIFTTPLRFKLEGEGMQKKCTAFATEKTSGEVCSAECSMQLAKDEGWLAKPGSKWKTMPDMMLKYRSAMFFARINCPEVLLGMSSADEVQDVVDAVRQSDGSYSVKAATNQRVQELNDKLNVTAATSTQQELPAEKKIIRRRLNTDSNVTED